MVMVGGTEKAAAMMVDVFGHFSTSNLTHGAERGSERPPAVPVARLRSKSAECSECCSELGGEELRLFPGRKVTALVDLVARCERFIYFRLSQSFLRILLLGRLARLYFRIQSDLGKSLRPRTNSVIDCALLV